MCCPAVPPCCSALASLKGLQALALLDGFKGLHSVQHPFAQVVILLQVYTSMLAALTVGLLGSQDKLQSYAEVTFIETQSALPAAKR